MNKSQYLAELSQLLVFMTRADREQTLTRYSALFDKAGPDREQALLTKIGSPTRSAIRLSRIYAPGQLNDEFLDGLEAEYEQAPVPEPEPEPEKAEAAPDVVEGMPDLDIPPLVMDDLSAFEPIPQDQQTPAPQEKKAPASAGTRPRKPRPQGARPQGARPPRPRPQGAGPQGAAAPAAAPQGTRPQTPGPQGARPQAPKPQNKAPQAAGAQDAAAQPPKAETKKAPPKAPAPASEPPRFVSMPLEGQEEDTEEQAPEEIIERAVPLWLGVPLFILSLLLLALPIGLIGLILLPVLLAPGLVLLLCTWLAAVGGLWCISYIADAVMLFGLAFLIFGLALIVLWCGLRLDVAIVRGYVRACRGVTHLTLGRKVIPDA